MKNLSITKRELRIKQLENSLLNMKTDILIIAIVLCYVASILLLIIF